MAGNQHICRFCNKVFPCGRSLGGHMRSHLINISSSDHRKIDEKQQKKKGPPLVKANKPLNSSEEDTLLQEKICKECGKTFHSWKALFGHMKSHSVRKLITDSESDDESATPLYKRKRSSDQQEQEEVAWSLIILSRDKGDWRHVDSSTQKDDFCKLKKNDFEKKSSKFTCSICKKVFASYQALGGHRASHKKFKGCCAPSNDNDNDNDNDNAPNHECPICFRVFSSGQALGGHKRSHVVANQADSQVITPSVESREIRSFLDLNLPAPAEEECDGFEPWWKHDSFFGLISS